MYQVMGELFNNSLTLILGIAFIIAGSVFIVLNKRKIYLERKYIIILFVAGIYLVIENGIRILFMQ